MPLFRCTVCRRDFEGDRAKCDPCGIDPLLNPRHADRVIPLVTVHLDPPSHVPGIGLGHAACDPAVKTGRPGEAFTGEKSAVNCPRCKASEAFRADGPPPMPADFVRMNRLPDEAERSKLPLGN